MTMAEQVSHPASWHRRLCELNEWLALSGDLATTNHDEGRVQLQQWVDAGITDIIDLREEWSDETFVAKHAPEVRYHYLGTHDDGGWQEDHWFEAGLAAIANVRERGGKAIVHCHMGVNRAPSMAFRMLLAADYTTIDALETIRTKRPIAGIIYAPAAIDHHLRTIGANEDTTKVEKSRVREWLSDNPVDIYWVISRIRQSES